MEHSQSQRGVGTQLSVVVVGTQLKVVVKFLTYNYSNRNRNAFPMHVNTKRVCVGPSMVLFFYICRSDVLTSSIE
jgi:hypothetical protein